MLSMRRFLVLLLFCQLACAQTGGWRVVVLANTIDSSYASDMYSSLGGRGVSVVKSDSRSFDILKDSPYIVILGGQNSPEGVGAISRGLLSPEEQDSLLKPGYSGDFVKVGVYSLGQKIHIFAGNEFQDTRNAWTENIEKLLVDLTGGLQGLSITGPTALVISPKSNIMSVSFPVNVTNSSPSNVSKGQVMAFLNGGIRLPTEPASFDLTPGESRRVLVKLNPRNVTTGDMVSVTFGGSQAKTWLNVTEYEKVPVCNVCAASDVK
jgi:hypothetical protein